MSFHMMMKIITMMIINGSGDDGLIETQNIESLRNKLFSTYNKESRPVVNYDDSVDLQYGIEIVYIRLF